MKSEKGMFSEVNSSKLDLPEYSGDVTSYIIASTPRCGSTLLGHLLWKSGIAGAPHEYFHPSHASDYYSRWECQSHQGYINLLKRWRTSSNGFFGIKLHYYQINEFGLDIHSIKTLLDEPKYIFLRRKTKIRQAISLVKAVQTNQYALQPGEFLANAEYDFNSIREQLIRLINEENKWEEYFTKNNISPLVVWYEDLANNYANILKRIYEYLGIDELEAKIPEPSLRKMSDATTEEWVKKFNYDMEIFNKKNNKL